MPEGVKIEPDRVQIILEKLKPASHRNVQVFLSFANLYKHFISSFLLLSEPMADILKGGKNLCFSGPFIPTLAMRQSSAQLREAFTKTPVLAHFDLAKPISLETDASEFAIVGIILQQQDNVCVSTDSVARGANDNMPTREGH